MGRVTFLLLFVAACGGTQIPQGNGYKGGELFDEAREAGR